MASLETIEALIKEKFKQNSEQHFEIIAHQKETNGRVKENENFRLKVEDELICLIEERNNMVRRITDFFWKVSTGLVLIGLATYFGLEKFL